MVGRDGLLVKVDPLCCAPLKKLGIARVVPTTQQASRPMTSYPATRGVQCPPHF